MTTVAETVTPAVPSRLALQNLTETLAALVDEAMALMGVAEHCGQGTIILSRVPAAVWHALPGSVHTSPEYTWKIIAQNSTAHISAFCVENAGCSENPAAEPRA